MKGRCEELGGTWIAKDYSLNPYTCEMGGKNYAVVNNPKNVYKKISNRQLGLKHVNIYRLCGAR